MVGGDDCARTLVLFRDISILYFHKTIFFCFFTVSLGDLEGAGTNNPPPPTQAISRSLPRTIRVKGKEYRIRIICYLNNFAQNKNFLSSCNEKFRFHLLHTFNPCPQ